VAELATTGGKLGSGREVSVSFGIGVRTSIGVSVATGVVVACFTGARRDRGPGLIGRTGSKYCGARCWTGCGCDGLTVIVGWALSLGCGVTDAVGEIEAPGLSLGEAFGDSVGDAVAVGDRGIVRFLFFGFGFGVGRTKSFFSLSPSVSFCSSVARKTDVLIASAVTITKTRRSFFFTRISGSQLL
jgi:hypothetical protein